MKKNLKRTARITRYVIYKETLIDTKEHFWSFVGAFVGIGIIAYIQSFWFTQLENVFLIGSFGASSVLIYGAIDSPLAQPRNLIGGHLVSAIIGVTVAKLFPDMIYIAAPLAVSLSIVGMQITKTIHPPGGATALIAVADTGIVKSLGYYYVLSPVLSGALILFLVAMVFNNITSNRSYPKHSKHSKFFLKRKTKGVFRR